MPCVYCPTASASEDWRRNGVAIVAELQTPWARAIAPAIDQAIKSHKRWQHVFELHATDFDRAHGASETSRRVPAAVDSDFIKQWKTFQYKLIGAAAAYLKPTLGTREKETVSLDP